MNMPKSVKTLIDLKEFKRGMLGVLKLLTQESLEHQRLDYYSLYSTMHDIVENFTIPDSLPAHLTLGSFLEKDEEGIARIILKFPNSEQKVSES